MTLGDEVKIRRIRLGLSQDWLANRCGLTVEWVEQLESGQFQELPPLAILFHIAQVLGARPEDLIAPSAEEQLRRTVLMNAAMMPIDGVYIRREINQTEFVSRIQNADRCGLLVSYIGYQQTARHIRNITGVDVQVSRDNTRIIKNDAIVVCKLRKRIHRKHNTDYVKEDAEKELSDKDFQYLAVEYRGKEAYL